MAWLLVDTASSRAVVAVADNERTAILAERALEEPQRHAESLAAAVDDALADARVAMADVVGVGVGCGPGSFIGVRTGLSFALGLGRARGVPVVGISGVAALAASAPVPAGATIVAVVDAKRGERYVARVRFGDDGGLVRCDDPVALVPAAIEIEAAETVVGAVEGLQEGGAGAHVMRGPTAEGLRRALLVAGAHAPPVPVYVRDADAKVPAQDPAARRARVMAELDAADGVDGGRDD